MEFSDLSIRLLFLFLPGIIAAATVFELTIQKNKSALFYGMEAFVFGSMSYMVLSVFKDVSFLECIFDETLTINVAEIAWASLLGLLLGLVASAMSTYELFHKFARLLRITRKFAESDVWGHLFNSPDISESWVVIRDYSNSLVYEGWVEYFSDDVRENELFIRDVIVYKDTNEKLDELYKLDGIYFSRETKDYIIEFRSLYDSKKKAKPLFTKPKWLQRK